MTDNEMRLADAKTPTKLPQGLTEFKSWADDILDLYGLPNNDSTHFALATTIMHLPADKGYMPKEYFGMTLIKGAATQVAYQVMQDCKERQAADAAKSTPVEATTPPTGAASDVPTQE